MLDDYFKKHIVVSVASGEKVFGILDRIWWDQHGVPIVLGLKTTPDGPLVNIPWLAVQTYSEYRRE